MEEYNNILKERISPGGPKKAGTAACRRQVSAAESAPHPPGVPDRQSQRDLLGACVLQVGYGRLAERSRTADRVLDCAGLYLY